MTEKMDMCGRVNLCFALMAAQNSSDGRMVRAFASGAVDWGLVPSRVKPMTLKLIQ